MEKIRSARFEAAKICLANCLASVSAGQALPSVRDLIAASGTTRAAVEQAVRHYRERGEIEARPRVGLFKTGTSAPGRILDLVACHDGGYTRDPSGFLFDVLMHLHRVCAEHGYAVRLHSVRPEESAEKYIRLSRLPDSGGFVLLLASCREIVSAFLASGRPTVCLFPHGKFTDVDQVTDAHGLVELQMNHLIGLGHRRIVYLREEFPAYQNSTVLSRRMQYYQLMARNGLRVYPHWQASYLRGEAEKALAAVFEVEPAPTALIVYDTDLPEVYRFLESRHLKIGADVSVIATDGSGAIAKLRPAVTSVVSHSRHAVETVWELLEKQQNGDRTPKTVEVMLTFKEGRSTGKAPEDSPCSTGKDHHA